MELSLATVSQQALRIYCSQISLLEAKRSQPWSRSRGPLTIFKCKTSVPYTPTGHTMATRFLAIPALALRDKRAQMPGPCHHPKSRAFAVAHPKAEST